MHLNLDQIDAQLAKDMSLAQGDARNKREYQNLIDTLAGMDELNENEAFLVAQFMSEMNPKPGSSQGLMCKTLW